MHKLAEHKSSTSKRKEHAHRERSRSSESNIHFKDVRPETNAATQLQAIADSYVSQQSVPIQKKKNNTGLPDNLKSGIENLSGYSMDDVKVHYNSNKPAQLNAHAYAQGSNIHLAAGQEKHLPHEAWHVVQQKQRRVKPTKQLKGRVNVNDDLGLEKEADVMGQMALSADSVERLETGLNTSPNVEPTQLKKVSMNRDSYASIQRQVDSGLPIGTYVWIVGDGQETVYQVTREHIADLSSENERLQQPGYWIAKPGQKSFRMLYEELNQADKQQSELGETIKANAGARNCGVPKESLEQILNGNHEDSFYEGQELLEKVLLASIVADADVYDIGIDMVSLLCNNMARNVMWGKVLYSAAIHFIQMDAEIRVCSREHVNKDALGFWNQHNAVVIAGKNDVKVLAETLLHELTHMVLSGKFDNEGLPYKGEATGKLWTLLQKEWIVTEQKQSEFNDFFRQFFKQDLTKEICGKMMNLFEYYKKGGSKLFDIEVLSHFSEVCYIVQKNLSKDGPTQFIDAFFPKTKGLFDSVTKIE